MTNLVGIPANMLADEWPVIQPLIIKACAGSNGRFMPSDMAKAIAEREIQLWAMRDGNDTQGITLTRLVKFPRLTACELIACVGENMSEWVDNISVIEAWAKENGAKQSHAVARKGWARVLDKYGYEHTHSLLEKTL